MYQDMSRRKPPRPIALALIYKNFGAVKGISHIGLGVAALNSCKVLRREGIDAHVWPILDAQDLREQLKKHPHLTHAVISAPWIPVTDLLALAYDHPETQFTVNCHSNVGFLQADSNGVANFKELVHAEHGSWNVSLAGNSEKFCAWVHDAFEANCTHLPNLYYLDHTSRDDVPRYQGGVLKIGAFGATRPLKNLMSAAGAAFELSAQLRCEVQLWISGGREDGGNAMIRAIQKLFEGETQRRLHVAPWAPWPVFRTKYVRSMHLLLQPSYTESFNVVTADGIAMGVPSVVSEAISWAPKHWQVDNDDVFEIARVARGLLSDRHAARDGLRALERHVAAGIRAWMAFLYGRGQHSPVHGHARATEAEWS